MFTPIWKCCTIKIPGGIKRESWCRKHYQLIIPHLIPCGLRKNCYKCVFFSVSRSIKVLILKGESFSNLENPAGMTDCHIGYRWFRLLAGNPSQRRVFQIYKIVTSMVQTWTKFVSNFPTDRRHTEVESVRFGKGKPGFKTWLCPLRIVSP